MFDRYSNDGTALVLSEEDVTFLRTVVSPDTLENDDVSFEICPTCASPTWKGTRGDGNGLTTMTQGSCCGRCEGFRHRHPEVFGFVTTFVHASRFIQLRLPAKDGESTAK